MSIKSFPDLAKFAARPFPVGYPVEDHVTLYSPEDNVHGALAYLIDSVTESLVLAIYGFDDDALASAILRKLQDPKIYVSLSLDSSQAAGTHERKLLATMNYPSNSVSYGRSEKGAIMHEKLCVIDNLDTIDGSTNWSISGESKQDNSLVITRHPLVAARARTRCDLIHEAQLTQMEAKRKAAGGQQ